MIIETKYTEKDLHNAFSSYYSSVWTFKIFPVLGTIALALPFILYGIHKRLTYHLGLLLVVSLFCFIFKWIIITFNIKEMKSNKSFGSANVVEFFTDGRIEARTETAKAEIRIDSFIHYRVSKGWIFLFIQKSIFVPIRISDLTPNGTYEGLTDLLHEFGIERKGK